MKKIIDIFVLVACATAMAVSAATPLASNGLEERIETLLAKMTLEEKIGQLCQINGNAAKNPEAQDFSKSRLGIPLLVGHDLIHSAKTAFPIPLALSCAWDEELWERTGASIAVEALTLGLTRTEAIREKLVSCDRDHVFVAMHRGDWRNFPENSKGAILSSIRLGADIVELDVHMTKDGRFILNHDRTLDRTTTGKGKVHDLTLAEIKQFKMRDKDGRPTDYDVLTLEEALELTRGRILVNIDKFTKHPREILDAVDAAGALKEVLVKSTLPIDKAKELFGPYWAKVESGELLYMPVAHIGAGNGHRPFAESVVPGYLAAEPRKASMYEVCFNDPSDVPEALSALKEAPGAPRIWVNTLWDSLSAKHSDFAALTEPDANWGWWLDRGVTMIQTDYAAELLVYLMQKGRRKF